MEDSVNSTVKKRYTMVDGQFKIEVIPQFTSRYELAEEHDEFLCCWSRSFVIRDRQSGEVFGQLRSFGIKDGWLDDFFLSLIPGNRSGRLCEDTSSDIRLGSRGLIEDLIKTIQPLGAK